MEEVIDDLDMLNIVKTENVLSKDNKGSRHINILTDSSIAHPLLPLFHSQTPPPAEEKSSKIQKSFIRLPVNVKITTNYLNFTSQQLKVSYFWKHAIGRIVKLP